MNANLFNVKIIVLNSTT